MIRLYTMKEAAEVIGVSVPTVYKLMAAGELAYYQVPGGRQVSEEDIEKYFASTHVPAGKKEAIHA